MGKLNSNQVAESFCKGNVVECWLTRKQANWLLGVAYDEMGRNGRSHFGRRSANGSFQNDAGLFMWEAHEGYHGSALLKVRKVVDEPREETLSEFVSKKGYNLNEIMNTELLGKLAVEWSNVRKGSN